MILQFGDTSATEMGILVAYLLLCMHCALAYRGANQRLTVVPNSEIQPSETEIILNKNLITELLSNEFSGYTSLTLLNLRSNRIHAVAPTAFDGTPAGYVRSLLQRLD